MELALNYPADVLSYVIIQHTVYAIQMLRMTQQNQFGSGRNKH